MNCDCNTIICSNISMGTDTVVLIPNRTINNVSNTGNYRLILATSIPEATANYPVEIQVGDITVPVLCKYGNQVLANQLNRRVSYPIGYGNQNENYEDGQFVILSCNCLNARGTISTTV